MSNLSDFISKIEKDKTLPLCCLSNITIETTQEKLFLDTETPFEKSIEKDYSLRTSYDFSEDYKYLLNIELLDYGYEVDGDEELQRFVSENSCISYEVEHVSLKEKKVYLKGDVFGDIMFLESALVLKAVIKKIGVTHEGAENLALYKELLIEGQILEKEKNHKMAFFTYFTALEAYLSLSIVDVKESIPKELHKALERTDLLDKVKITIKHNLSVSNVNTLEFWGELMSLVKKSKDIRNDIAHGKFSKVITEEDVNTCFTMVSSIIASCEFELTDFVAIRKTLYQKPYELRKPIGRPRPKRGKPKALRK